MIGLMTLCLIQLKMFITAGGEVVQKLWIKCAMCSASIDLHQAPRYVIAGRSFRVFLLMDEDGSYKEQTIGFSIEASETDNF